MHGYLKLCVIVYWLALIAWISALVSAAVAAMNVFPGMDRMPLALEQYPGYPVEEHPRLAAGRIMDGVFFTVDLVQFAAIPFVLLTLALQLTVFRLKLRRPANALRTACLVVAAGLFTAHATAIAPSMNRSLRDFWKAAEAGDVETARARRAEFNELHPTADTILRLDLLLALAAAAASAAALAPAPGSSGRSGSGRSGSGRSGSGRSGSGRPGRTAALERPELLSRR